MINVISLELRRKKIVVPMSVHEMEHLNLAIHVRMIANLQFFDSTV